MRGRVPRVGRRARRPPHRDGCRGRHDLECLRLYKASQEETTMLRQTSSAARMLALAAAFALPTVGLAQDNRPVVVVFRFDNNSIGAGRADFDGVQTGLQDLLITDLASNTKIRLVDRAHINEVLAEQ